MDDTQFHVLLQQFNLSWRGYRKIRKGVKKRLRRHMLALGCMSIDDYIKTIDNRPEEKAECRRLLTVPITRFFRDRNVWEILEYHVLPSMIMESDKQFRVWSAGCSGGEEAYSFAIVWQRLNEKRLDLPPLDIFATDMNPDCLDRARAGVYPISSLREVSEETRQMFFSKKKKQFQVIQAINRMVRLEKRNLFEAPPDTEIDILFLRNNLLTYYQEPDKSEGFKTITSRLKASGVLVIGAHESLPDSACGFMKTDEHPLIYRRDV